jgi:hypothetical protein
MSLNKIILILLATSSHYLNKKTKIVASQSQEAFVFWLSSNWYCILLLNQLITRLLL